MTSLFQHKKAVAFERAISDQFPPRKVTRAGDPLSWGQFLDNLNQQTQVGLYGTVSACLVFKIARGANDNNAQQVQQALESYWDQRNANDDFKSNLTQNIRLAMLLLALSALHPFSDRRIQEIWEALKQKRHPAQHTWAASRAPSDSQFEAAEYATSIILVILSLIRRLSTGSPADFADLDQIRAQSAEALQNLYLADTQRQRPFIIILLLSVILAINKKADRKIIGAFEKYAFQSVDIKQRYTYFFDYQKANGDFSRDFLIVPTTVLATYVLFLPDPRGKQYLLATRALIEIEKSLKATTEGLFKAGVERPSTMEQALVVVALHAYSSHKPARISTIWPTILWKLQRDLEHERLAALFVLVGAYGPLALFAMADTVLDALSGHLLPHRLVYALVAFSSTPKWLITGTALVAAVVGKPVDLAKALLRGKK